MYRYLYVHVCLCMRLCARLCDVTHMCDMTRACRVTHMCDVNPMRDVTHELCATSPQLQISVQVLTVDDASAAV